MKLGLDRFIEEGNEHGNIGLITNATGVDSNIRYNFDIIRNVKKIFVPEQGLFGTKLNGESIDDESINGIPVYSLYGKRFSIPGELLEDLDLLIYDMEDAGVRYFTFVSTLKNLLISAKDYDMKVLILDRPNPLNAYDVYGPIMPKEYSSFVGPQGLPIKYGMTPGELAIFLNREVQAEVKVMEMTGYHRTKFHNELLNFYIPLSLHLPTFESVLNYQAFCILEGTNISVGRGTPFPFTVIGAPGLKNIETEAPGFVLRRTKFRPAYSLYASEEIDGFQVHITDPHKYNPFWLVFDVIKSYKNIEVDDNKIRKLLGDNSIFEYIENKISFKEIEENWSKSHKDFLSMRKESLIYS